MEKSSLMDDYMASYGQRLQSLLAGTSTPAQARAAPPVQMQAPASALAPAGPGAPPGGPPQAGPAPGQPAAPGQGGGTSFRQQWQQSSEDQQKEATDDLEKQLKAGNQTIDTAYDDLVKQMGTRPGPDEKLSREEKGMFLMEFGLSLMANSSGQAYGQDLGGAIGASGLKAMQNQRGRRQTERDRYDSNLLAVNTRRADSKADLAKQSALEARSEARDQRRSDRENSQLAGVVTQDDNTVVGYTRGGGASVLELPGGKPVQAKPKPLPGSGGAHAPRTLVEDRRYKMYLDTYGKDAQGQPLTGEALSAVEKRALNFAVDPKAATLSEGELRSMAERSADAFQKSNWAQFRDMKPDEIKTWRDKNAEDTYQRLKKGEDAALEAPTPPKSAPGRGAKPRSALEGKSRTFASQDEIRSALAAKEINFGDTVTLNGKSFTIQPKPKAQ